MTISPQADEWHRKALAITPRTEAFIDGRYVAAASGETFDCVNPANGTLLAKVAAGDAEDVDRAVQAARRSFESGKWSRMAPAERKKILLKFAELINQNSEELALLETMNMGKPITNSHGGDIPGSANSIAWFAELIDKVYDQIAPTPSDSLALITREPLGVVGAVVPWNFPLMMACWKLGPALATGNSVVLKPAEQSPLSALRVAELAMEAGLPEGVLNVVPGLGETAGRAIGLHQDIDVVAFTGSTEVGKLFMQYSGQSNMKRVSLECGGKSPHIVLADCSDISAAARAVAFGIFYNQGEVCSAGSRLIVEEAVKDELLEKVVEWAGQFQPSDPLDPDTKMGAIVDRSQLEKVLGLIETGQAAGAEIRLGGKRVRADTGGYYVEPTVFDRVDNSMQIAQEEIFGPVLSTITVSDVDEAVRVGNDTMYGLAGAIWTRDISKAHRVARALRAGLVWVNCFDRGTPATPWGGFKASGFGRDKSIHAIDKYTDLKLTWITY